MDYLESRECQARNDLPVSAQNELLALSELKECQSTGTPILVDSFQDKQSANMCVPGGFLLFLLMTHCPGVPVPDFRTRPLEEREDIRQAFRIAYEYISFFTLENYWRLSLMVDANNVIVIPRECLRCNVLNSEHGWENLLWEAENKKWLVDRRFLDKHTSILHTDWVSSYIVDFKSLGRARSGTEWGDHVLKWWMLQERRKT